MKKQNTLIVRCLLVLGIFTIALAVTAPIHAWSTQSTAGPGPYLIATVDLERVFNDSSLRPAHESDLDVMRGGFEKRLKELEHDATMLQMDLEAFQVGTQNRKDAEEKLKNAVVAYEAMIEMSETTLARARLEAKREIYKEIIAAAGEFAKTHGIAFVLTDDKSVDLDAATEIQLVQQMALRRLVYGDPAYDITSQVIKWIDER